MPLSDFRHMMAPEIRVRRPACIRAWRPVRLRGMNAALARQLERLRAMTADEKYEVAHALWAEARDVLASGIRARHPDWSEEQVSARVRERMRGTDA